MSTHPPTPIGSITSHPAPHRILPTSYVAPCASGRKSLIAWHCAQASKASAAQRVTELEAKLTAIAERVEEARATAADANRECSEVETAMVALRPRLCFREDLSDCVALCIVKLLRLRWAGLFAMVSRGFRDHVAKARELGMLKSGVLGITAGGHHTVACLDTEVYTFEGSGPMVVLALTGKKVVGASAGNKHTVVWTEGGEVYTFGDGGAGRLGHGGSETELVPRVVQALVGKGVVGASAGGRHTVVWTEGGEVYTFGYVMFGQLGHGAVMGTPAMPTRVQALTGNKVVGAAAGGVHTVVWTEGGEVYTFGYGRFGRLGHGGEENELGPKVVRALTGKKVVGASAGNRHTVVWTEGGEVYTFGRGSHGQLGPGGEQTVLAPRAVEALAGKKVVGASAGDRHTVVWTEGGEVYTFGYGVFGQLGHGGQQTELAPRAVEALAGKKVVGASAGDRHTVVWTEGGEVYTFGYGQLGHGVADTELVPRVVERICALLL